MVRGPRPLLTAPHTAPHTSAQGAGQASIAAAERLPKRVSHLDAMAFAKHAERPWTIIAETVWCYYCEALQSKTVPRDEFLRCASRPLPGEAVMRRRLALLKIFRQWDTDDSGYLSRDELRTALNSLPRPKLPRKLYSKRIPFDELFAILDESGDGLVDLLEFVERMPSELQVAIAEGTDRTGMIASFVDDGRNRWLKNVFASFDADGSGTLSSSELRAALGALERCGVAMNVDEVVSVVFADAEEIDLARFVVLLPTALRDAIARELSDDGTLDAFLARAGRSPEAVSAAAAAEAARLAALVPPPPDPRCVCCLVAHGECVGDHLDPAQPLSEAGREQAEGGAAALLTMLHERWPAHVHGPMRVFTCHGKQRCAQTGAAVVSLAISLGAADVACRTLHGMLPGDLPGAARTAMDACAGQGGLVVVVGNARHLARLAQSLSPKRFAPADFKPGQAVSFAMFPPKEEVDDDDSFSVKLPAVRRDPSKSVEPEPITEWDFW